MVCTPHLPSPPIPTPAYRSGRKGPVEPKTPSNRCPRPATIAPTPINPPGAPPPPPLRSPHAASIKLKLASLNRD